MDFLEAVKAMKEGKRVIRPVLDYPLYIPEGETIICERDASNTSSMFHVGARNALATDWEIVDEDKDWNLADNSGFEQHCGDYVKIKDYDSEQPRTNANLFERQDVKKTRDLILIDLELFDDICPVYDSVIEIINKRFGDLQ